MTAYTTTGLKLLILTADYPPCGWSGIAAAASNQALALLHEDASVSVLTRFVSSPPPVVRAAVEVRSLQEPVFPFRGTVFNWIHLHSLALAELAFELRRRYGSRIAYTAHSVISHELEKGSVRSLWSETQLAVMRQCDAVILVSESERKTLFSEAPTIARRAHVIGNAVPVPTPRPRPYNHRGPVVFAGRFTANKGLSTLRQFLPALSPAWQGLVVLAGGHGDSAGSHAIRDLRVLLGDALSTPGWLNRAELDNLLAAASLVVVPSRYEPFGMIAVEAMRMGTPVLAARVGGLAEIVTEESGGRLVDGPHPMLWRDQALDILRDHSLAASLAERGPEYVRAHYNPSIMAGRLLREIYAN
jgi:1,4-alpha-glucan branching enzyme